MKVTKVFLTLGASQLARETLGLVLLMCATNAHADGGVGPFTWESLKELWAPLLTYGLLTYFLLFALGVTAFIFVGLHFVLLAFLIRAVVKNNFCSKGIRYSAALLVIGYASIVALIYWLGTTP